MTNCSYIYLNSDLVVERAGEFHRVRACDPRGGEASVVSCQWTE